MNTRKINLWVVLTLLMTLVVVAGCAKSDLQQSAGKEIPKLDYHLPKTFPAGVARLRELLDAANSENPLPSPISYDVLEIQHGTGAAAHSHFYPLDESKKQEIDNHGHETTGETTHTVTVGFFEEFYDLALGLPNIAIDGDMEEETWGKVKAASTELSNELEKAFKSSNTDEEKRTAFKQHIERISAAINQLEKLVLTSSESLENN